MTTRTAIAAVVLLTAGIWSSEPELRAGVQADKVQREILEAERQREVALAKRDMKALEHVYDDDYMLIRPSGQVENKEQVLKRIESRGLPAKSMQPVPEMRVSNVAVRAYGDVAIHSSLEHFPPRLGSGLSGRRAWVTRVYLKRSTGWRLAHVQETFVED